MPQLTLTKVPKVPAPRTLLELAECSIGFSDRIRRTFELNELLDAVILLELAAPLHLLPPEIPIKPRDEKESAV